MLFSEALGRKVVSTSDATTVGLISGFVIDPAQRRVVALTLSKPTGGGPMLPWSGINAFGADAVTVSGANALVGPEPALAELDGKAHAILHKRVLTSAGYQVGTVRDVEFDPADGRLISLVLDERGWDGQALLGVGSYAVVVRG
jgi:sporulation protein YlmC with PRC-barrel domain